MLKAVLCVGVLLVFCCQATALPPPPVSANHAMVVSEQHLASQVGVDILQAGGNAIDAAVAVGYALAVVNPCCGNLGGGGFMTIHLANGKNLLINFREKAPLAATRDMFLDAQGKPVADKSLKGYLAVAVPGTVMGLNTALKKYGTLPLRQVLEPAIQLASKGFILTAGDVLLLDKYAPAFKDQKNVAAIFLHNDQAYKVGDNLQQKELAHTLQLIAEQGSDAFYRGTIAGEVVAASHAHGGILSLTDFNSYSVQELMPVTCTYRGYDIVAVAPPSSGGVTLCEMLNILQAYPLARMGYHTAESAHYMIEAMRLAFHDRNTQLGDPDFIKNPVQQLTAKDYAAKLRAQIPARGAVNINPSQSELLHEGKHTTHYSVVDKFGNAVAVTYTLNALFGADIIAGNTGFLLNDSMDDFTVKPGSPNMFGLIQGSANQIEPGKRPLSAMSPTIVLRNGKPILILGSPGGPRIITTTLETIINVVDFGMNIQQAVDAPRFHQQWLPLPVDVEPNTFSDNTLQALLKMGYQFNPVDHWGAVEAIYIDPVSKKIYGGSDRRRPAGKAIGY